MTLQVVTLLDAGGFKGAAERVRAPAGHGWRAAPFLD
jgi:hypothetical protein